MIMAANSLASRVLWILCALVVGLRAQDIPTPPQPGTQPCIGFTLSSGENKEGQPNRPAGNVFLTCSGRTSQLTDSGDIASWAIDVTGSKLTLLRVISNDESTASLEVIALPTRKIERKAVVQARSRLTR